MTEQPDDRDDRDDLTDEQLEHLGRSLAELAVELRRMLALSREASRPVDLGQPIGRLTRMDAMQQQSMTAASRREFDLRLRQVEQALTRIDRESYGECLRCEEPIGVRRLEARPESPYCVECQNEIDLRQS